ncbi:unnamed protein product [Ranitomeya imitator]|uniref:Ig-like domain-containing protein n=1 Tax=Ranitomeya imitator TaxID=111125 RepID=A0ABN9LEH1_9NEOB|nr:unnamed protein product [Ranitomeya imitator]
MDYLHVGQYTPAQGKIALCRRVLWRTENELQSNITASMQPAGKERVNQTPENSAHKTQNQSRQIQCSSFFEVVLYSLYYKNSLAREPKTAMMIWLYLILNIALPASICRADYVTQSKHEETAIEGNQVTLDCEYETKSTSPYLFWYVQYPGKSPLNIIRKAGFKEEKEPSMGKFSARPVDKKFIPLLISHLNPSDTGVYFCAVSDTVCQYRDITGQEPVQSYMIQYTLPF